MTLEEVLQSGNYALIDVREPMELEMDGDIDGAENIPLGEVADRKDEILSIEKPVVLFCRSGNRSSQAKKILENYEKLDSMLLDFGIDDNIEFLSEYLSEEDDPEPDGHRSSDNSGAAGEDK